MLATVVASMSDRLDGQAQLLDKLTKTAAETRAAAFHAKSQMDMKPVAAAITDAMGKDVGPIASHVQGLQREIAADRAKTQKAFEDFVRSTSDVIEQRRRQIEGLRTRNWIPITACCVLVTAIVTTAVTPWALAQVDGHLLCFAAGGYWFEGLRQCML